MKIIGIAGLVLAALLIGAFGGAILFPTDKIVYQDKIVNQTVTNEVVKTVQVNNTIDVFADAKANAIAEYKAKLEDNDNSELDCDSETFDFDQVKFNKLSDLVISIDASDEDDTITTVSFEQNLKFSDKDVESKCYRTDSVSVEFHSDEDIETEVSIN